MKRRRHLDRMKPKDTREIITIGNLIYSYEDYAASARRRMQMLDAMPPEYRDVVHEFNIDLKQTALCIRAGVSAATLREAAQRKSIQKNANP